MARRKDILLLSWVFRASSPHSPEYSEWSAGMLSHALWGNGAGGFSVPDSRIDAGYHRVAGSRDVLRVLGGAPDSLLIPPLPVGLQQPPKHHLRTPVLSYARAISLSISFISDSFEWTICVHAHMHAYAHASAAACQDTHNASLLNAGVKTVR